MIGQETKIFAIGLSRTGTLSLTRALTDLGIAAKHYPNDARTRDELKRGCYSLSILESVQALLDIPLAPFYPQFDRRYPGSKFILTTRPTDSWLRSMETHFRFYVDHRKDDFDEFILACVYGLLHYDAERLSYVKELHESNVRAYFADAPDKLLVFDVFKGDAWPELCGFLGCPVPGEPFPHENLALKAPSERPSGSLMRQLTRRLRG